MLGKKDAKKWDARLYRALDDLLEYDEYEFEFREIKQAAWNTLKNGSKMCVPVPARINHDTKRIVIDPRYGEKEKGIGLNHELVHYYFDHYLDNIATKKLSHWEKKLKDDDKMIDDLAVALYDSGVSFLEYLPKDGMPLKRARIAKNRISTKPL